MGLLNLFGLLGIKEQRANGEDQDHPVVPVEAAKECPLKEKRKTTLRKIDCILNEVDEEEQVPDEVTQAIAMMNDERTETLNSLTMSIEELERLRPPREEPSTT